MLFQGWFIDNYFNEYEIITDPNKDSNSRGTNERFMDDCIGAEIDAYMMPAIDDLVINTEHPLYAYDRHVAYIEQLMGYSDNWEWFKSLEIATRRRYVLKIYNKLKNIAGTIPCYEIMFSWVGLSCVITEDILAGYHFDLNPLDGWSDSDMYFDSNCLPCSKYSIALTGTGTMTADRIAALETIIVFNNPIDTVLTGVTFNASPVTYDISKFDLNATSSI